MSERSEPRTDAIPVAEPQHRGLIPRTIRTLAVPIILGWIALLVILNTVVPQLEEVGQMRAVSMSPESAPSMIAMKRVGSVFEEFKSDSSAMIVLEGDEPLGEAAHAFYDDMIDKLEADTKHVEHVQDFWGDPLTASGAQSADGKAAYVQVYLAGNQGEALANESVEAAQEIVGGLTPPPGVRAYVTGPSALAADQHIASDRSVQVIEMLTFTVIIVMLLIIYRSLVTTVLVLAMVVVELGITRGVVAFLGYHEIIGLSMFAVNLLVAIGVSLLEFMRRAWRPHSAVLVRVDGLKGYHEAERHPEGRAVPGLVLYRFDAPLFFANAGFFVADLLAQLQPDTRQVTVTAEPITDIDATAAETIGTLLDELARRQVVLTFAELKGHVRDQLDAYGLVERVGRSRFSRTVGEAVKDYVHTHEVAWQDWEDR